MMKNQGLKKYILLGFIICGFAVSARAFILPPGPVTPTVDPVSDVTFFIDTQTTTLQNITAQASGYVQSVNQQAKAAVSTYTGKFTGIAGGIFKKEKKQQLPGTKEIEESKNFDIYDPASVQQAIYELFFQYPVDCKDKEKPDNQLICQAYRNLAQEFYEDTVIELYTSTREIEKQFETIENSIQEIESALQEGKNGAESPDDENGVWKNAYNAYDTMNSLLKLIEEIEAIRVQYTAVQAIGSQMVYPMEPETEEQKTEEQKTDSSDKSAQNLFISDKPKIISKQINKEETLKFAQVFSENTSDNFSENTLKNVSENVTANKNEQVEKQQIIDEAEKSILQKMTDSEKGKPVYKRAVNFVAAPPSKLENPYAANKDNLALLENLNKAYETLKNAVEVHNQIKGLSTIQQVYDDYNKAKKLHEKALQSLKESEQCTIKYYSEMYEDPEKMWNGGVSIEDTNDLSNRKGLSGWAVKAYNIAKAEDTGMVVDSEDFSELNFDTSSMNDSELSQLDKAKNNISKDSAGFKDAAKKEKVDASLQESERLPWNIGSLAAQMLAKDQMQYGKNGQWGKTKRPYSVWKDTQAYYNQYLDGKYDGIKKQLNSLNVLNTTLTLVKELNKLVDNQEERQHNSDGINRLSSKLKQEEMSVTSSIDEIISAKKAKLDELYKIKEQKLAELAKKKQNIIDKINEIQQQLDKLNINRQDIAEEKQEAEKIQTAMEDKIKRLYKRQLDLPNIQILETETKEYEQDINAKVFEKHSNNTYQGYYSQTQRIVNAQLKMNPEEKIPEDFNQSDIHTYTETNNVVKEIERDEPQDLIEAQARLEDSRKKILNNEEQLINLNKQIEKLTQEQAALRQEIETLITPQEEAIKAQYVIDTNEVTLSFDKKIQAEEEKFAKELENINNIKLSDYYKEHFDIPITTGIGNLFSFSLLEILDTAQILMSDTRDAAKEMISDTLDEMYAMGDNLYNPTYHQQVVKHHKELMNKLKALPQKQLTEFSSNIDSYSNHTGIMSILKTVYQAYIVDDACSYGYCYTEDIEYFVSNNGKRRDFRAPKAVPEIPLPTLREMVYFDYKTYNNIPRNDSEMITADGFLENLPYVPEVWKYILRSPAYVEKEIDLSTIVIPSEERLANGGIYPCIYKDYIVTSIGDKYKLYGKIANIFSASEVSQEQEKYQEILKKGYQTCINIEITGSGHYLTVKNTADDVSGIAEVKSYSEFKEAPNNSELGQLLAYNSGLKYNTLAEKAFKRLSEENEDGKGELEQKDILYDKISLKQNQIGDFLKRVDFEQECRENMAEMSIEIASAKKTLYAIFNKIGFQPSDSFDLSKEDDYNQAYEVLMRYRNQLLASAISEVKDIKDNDNEVIAERMIKLNNLIKALQKDSNAYTVLEETSEDNAELDENIKSEQANRNVLSKYKAQANTDFEKQLKQIGNIYCAQLAGNM